MHGHIQGVGVTTAYHIYNLLYCEAGDSVMNSYEKYNRNSRNTGKQSALTSVRYTFAICYCLTPFLRVYVARFKKNNLRTD